MIQPKSNIIRGDRISMGAKARLKFCPTIGIH
jgi:hypothetical protein